MNVLVILGHPRVDSFSGALAEAYKQGALNAGMDVRQINVTEMYFDPNVYTISPRNQHFEEDILEAQRSILWADHLVFIYPTWWGTVPALLKGFLDRVLTPGFAFEELDRSPNWLKLLKGKTGQLVTTMDTPLWVFHWLQKSPGHHAMAKSTLQYCGVEPVKTLSFSPINGSTLETRKQWLEKVKEKGFELKAGFLTKNESRRRQFTFWFRAIRFQFYPMTFVAYAAGAVGASSLGYAFNSGIFWLGYLWLFLLEIATVLSNELFDYRTDRQNKFFGPFTGGSRVIVENRLSFRDVKNGILISLVLSLFAAILLLTLLPGSQLFMTGSFMFVLLIAALGYTIPPLKFSYRGLGELDVAFTHSFGVIVCGFLFQEGHITDSFPWLLGIPLFFAIVPSIILAGIPDYQADKLSSKKSIPVLLGRKWAIRLAMIFTGLAIVAAMVWYFMEIANGVFGDVVYLIALHGFILIYLLIRYMRNHNPPSQINGILFTALTFIIWFGIVPLIKLF